MHSVQIDSSLYASTRYLHEDRWPSYGRQFSAVRSCAPSTCLEVGIGNSIVTHALRQGGIAVTTCDIDPSVNPDHVGSVTDLPFPDHSFDCILCAQVLEHIPFADLPRAFSELHRVAKRHCVIMVPHPSATFSLSFKIPFYRRRFLMIRIPLFWRTHSFNGEHYWEMGMRGHSRHMVIRLMRGAGFAVREISRTDRDPYHALFVMTKRSTA